MTKVIDTFISVRIDLTVEFHVVHISVKHSDWKLEVSPNDDHSPIAWGFSPINYLVQSDQEVHCYGHHEPELSGKLCNLKQTITKADSLQKKLRKLEEELGPIRTPGDFLRRLATALKVKNILVWFENGASTVSEVASELDRSLSKFLHCA